MRGNRRVVASLLLLLTPCTSQSPALRGGERKLQQNPCVLVRVETELEEGVRMDDLYDSSIQCEMIGDDTQLAERYFVPVKGLDDTQKKQLKSGETTLIAGAATMLDGELHVPANAGIELFDTVPANRLSSSPAFGEKTVLVVRATASDSSTSASKEQLALNIFGVAGNESAVNLVTRYAACSYGKLNFQPFQGQTSSGIYVDNGVIEVNVDINVLQTDRYSVERELTTAAAALVGDLRQFDRVMLCLPPGSSSNSWVAYAYVNSWLAVYNDVHCQAVSSQVHEIGHTLNLAHSGVANDPYGDKSGMMGYSYNWIDRPEQCFDPAKNWQLGWYSSQTLELDPLVDAPFVGTLVGVSDFEDVSSSRYVVLKIENGDRDLYVGYNRRKGINRGTQQGINKILIVEQGDGYSISTKLKQLSVGELFNISNNRSSTEQNIYIQFTSVSEDLDEAMVEIYFDT